MAAATATATTAEQIDLLIEFMQQHPNFARNTLKRDIHGRVHVNHLWDKLKFILNSAGGAIRTRKQWKKVWADKKYFAKKNFNAALKSSVVTGGGPLKAATLSSTDLKILNIMGMGFVEPETEQHAADELEFTSPNPESRQPNSEFSATEVELVNLSTGPESRQPTPEFSAEEVELEYLNDAEDSVYRYNHVSSEQLKILLEFLQEHQTIAQGLHRGGRSKGNSRKYWISITEKLNSVTDGVKKDFKGWSKFWADWKYRVRRKAYELQAARENKTSESITPLSEMEEAVLKIIGKTNMNGPVIKRDPLSEEDDDFNEDEVNQFEEKTTSVKRRRGKARKRRHSSDSDDADSPLASLERKPTRTKNSEQECKDESAAFLRLEREKLEHTRAMRDQIETIATEMTRLSDAVCQIRDFLMSNRMTLQ